MPLRLLRALFVLLLPAVAASAVERADLIIYGGTSAGVVAAVQARRLDRTVILIEPGRHLGGMTTSGLGATDLGRREAVGGIAREFYARIYEHYLQPDAWRQETREQYLPRHKASLAEAARLQFFFEPHVAEQVFQDFLREHGVTVVLGERLDRSGGGVTKDGRRIVSIRMESGRVFAGGMFMDTTYEGDLMAEAGVSYTVGREPNAQYGETLNGIRYVEPEKNLRHVDVHVVPGDPASGLLPGILPAAPGVEGEGDRRLQAFTFRVCLTDDPANRVPIARPDDYDPLRYEVFARHLAVKPHLRPGGETLFKLTPMPNRKTDSNNAKGISTDYVGRNHAWAEASYAERERLWQEHRSYVQGLFWFLGNDPRLPEELRAAVTRWGLPKDEFADTGHWPRQLYVREARRMVSDYVITEHDCVRTRVAEDSVGLASYPMDSHQVTWYADADGKLALEGGFYKTVKPYLLSYRALVPREGECTNLFVPVCLSATHASYGSIRMEPVFMILAQSAATAAHLALQHGVPVQQVPYAELSARLLADGQVLQFPVKTKAKK